MLGNVRAEQEISTDRFCAQIGISYLLQAVHLWRFNSYTMIHGAPQWFLQYLELHLSVPVDAGTLPGRRFGKVYFRREQCWGTLLVGNRVPSGLTERVIAIANYYTQQGYPLPVEFHDKRERPEDGYPWFSVAAAWRPYQNWVHERVLAAGGSGIVDAPPRSGKTLMAARAIDALAQPTIYIAPSRAIVYQTYQTFARIFGESLVARYDGGEKGDIEKAIVVATVQSAVKLPKEWWHRRRLLIIDEFHHAAADTYYQVNDLAEQVYYRLCYTGTHWRTGEDALAMEGICSRVIASISVDYLVKQRFLSEPYVYFVPFRGSTFAAADWREAYQLGIVEHEQRNDLIVNYAHQLADEGHQVIVLTNRRQHADDLGDRIQDAQVAKGGEGILTSRTVHRFARAEFPVLVGTSVLGEGVDVPNASALIYAGGLGDSVQMMQSYFRPLTANTGKSHGRVYDFRDLHHPTLQRQAESRIALAHQYLGPWTHAPI